MSVRGTHAAAGSFGRDVTKQAVKAAVLIAVVVLVVYFVVQHVWGGSHSPASASNRSLPSASVPPSSAPPVATTLTPTTSTAPATTTTTLPAPAPATVTVVVLNGTHTVGAAKYFTTKLDARGYHTLAPLDATVQTVSATRVVVTAHGTRAGGEAVAAALGLHSSAVEAKPAPDAPIPADALSLSDVVVVVGSDLSSHVVATTTVVTGATA